MGILYPPILWVDLQGEADPKLRVVYGASHRAAGQLEKIPVYFQRPLQGCFECEGGENMWAAGYVTMMMSISLFILANLGRWAGTRGCRICGNNMPFLYIIDILDVNSSPRIPKPPVTVPYRGYGHYHNCDFYSTSKWLASYTVVNDSQL
jgi:hypothetical protein